MKRCIFAILVLLTAVAARATTCLDAVRYIDMGTNTFIQVYDAYVDSTYDYWSENGEYISSKYEYKNGLISKLSRDDFGEYYSFQFTFVDDESSLTGVGEELFYQKNKYGDTTFVVLKMFENGKETVFTQTKFTSTAMTVYDKEYKEKKCESGSCYIEINTSLYVSNDTLYDVVVQLFEDGSVDTTELDIYILDSQNSLKCTRWRYDYDRREFIENSKYEITENDGGFVLTSTRLHDEFLQKYFMRYVEGYSPSSIRHRLFKTSVPNKMFMRDLKGRKQNKLQPYRVIF